MQIQVRINEEGALRNQRYAFTNRFTLVSELLQNARRAGATCIEIHYDAATQVLSVHDDGCGLEDFQKLLSLHESGWHAATAAEERPFGVGFSKCLYAATRCVVTSGDQRVDIETKAALARALITVEQVPECETVNGTRVDLHGVDLPDLGTRVEELCLGFPVAVLFNGQPLKRPLAEGHLATQASPIGAVHLAGTLDGKYTHETMVFLQGFCVLKATYCLRDELNVVHLDSRQFMARLPDRDKLIDEDVQRKRIDAELKACWRNTLEIARTRLSPERFVETYYAVMRGWGQLDLLNDLDVLPAELCDAIVGYPMQDDHGSRDFVQQVAAAPKRSEIESGVVRLVALDSVGDDNGARWMLARSKGYLVFDWIGLHHDHWAQRHVRFLEEERAHVEAVEEQVRTALEGRWVYPDVILCEAVRIRVGKDEAAIVDEGVCHDGTLYIPAGESTGTPVQQLSSFTDEHDQFLDADCDADREALADLIRRLRSVDPVQTLDSLLQDLRLGKYPLLHGKIFQVTVGVGVSPGHSIELLEADGLAVSAESGAVMHDHEYAGRIDAVKQRAHGRWNEILASAGVDEQILKHRNGPCPLCGGTDRFQYTDKFGEGNYHCRQCGPGGGFKLLQAVKGVDFNAALRDVERCLGLLPEATTAGACEPSGDRMRKLVQRIWDEARPVTAGDEVDRYLRGRGLALPVVPAVLRFHPALGYYEKDEAGKSRKLAEYPAMLACIQGLNGHAVTLHRTYLKDGAKLKAADAKKVLSAGINGAAVRLFEATDELAVCEGIETGLALHLATRKPVWAGINAGNLEKLCLPDAVRNVCIYADNDADSDFAGQCFAFALARRLKREEKTTGARQVRVFVPRHAGTDWADVWCQRRTVSSAPMSASEPMPGVGEQVSE